MVNEKRLLIYYTCDMQSRKRFPHTMFIAYRIKNHKKEKSFSFFILYTIFLLLQSL